MKLASETLDLPEPIAAAAERLAAQAGVTLDAWIATAVAEKVAAIEDAARFFQQRANGRSRADLARVLAKVPDRTPDPGDERPA